MSNDDRTRIIHGKTPESAVMVADVKRATAITAALNRLTFNDTGEIRALFSELIGQKVDDSFLLIPPFYTAGGREIRVGRNVFVNQNCTFYDLGGLDIGDDVMIGPNVSILTAGHPVEPTQRRAITIGKPIAIEKNVWIAEGATIIGGVTVGENSVVAAGSVVTKDVPPNTLVGGNPARLIRSIGAPLPSGANRGGVLPNGFTVGRATAADYHEIVRDIVDFWGSDRTLRMHNAMYVHELVDSSFVIKDGDRVIAYLFGVVAESRKVAYSSLIGVRQSHRRQGLGERLYELFQDHARARGCTRLTAVTDPSNTNSIAFHTGKIGMRCRIVKDYGGPGEDRAVFEKEL